MAVEKDQPGLLPKAPPPRPARREAAIELALRRFDGDEIGRDEPAAAPRSSSSRAGRHRPQLAMLVSATLLLVVGIPAALIGLRDQPPTPERAPSSVVVRNSESVTPTVADTAPAMPSSSTAASVEPKQVASGRGVRTEALREAAAPPPAAPAPAPPPPAMAVAEADRANRDILASNIVVTGSRIQQPSIQAPSGAKVAQPNQAYFRFLSELQSSVRADDRRAIVRLIDLPLRVNFAGGARVYWSRKSVLHDWGRIFSPKVRRAILAQRPEQHFVRDQGAMIGTGEVWFDRSCANPACSPSSPIRIKAVNP